MELYVIRRPAAWANLQELEAAGAFALPKTASQKGKKGTKSSAGQDDLFQA